MSYKWQGESVEVEFGHYRAKPDHDRPLMWYNFECDTMEGVSRDGRTAIEAIRFKYDGRTMIISNHCGIGAHKLRHGGWPTHVHFSIHDELGGRFVPDRNDSLAPKMLDEPEYAKHEAAREAWMQAKYPKAYEKLVELRSLLKK